MDRMNGGTTRRESWVSEVAKISSREMCTRSEQGKTRRNARHSRLANSPSSILARARVEMLERTFSVRSVFKLCVPRLHHQDRVKSTTDRGGGECALT